MMITARPWRALAPVYTLLDRLFLLRARLAAPRRTRLAAELLEDRVNPDGRPLPFPVIYLGAGAAPVVRAFDAETGDLNFERRVFGGGFAGGVRVATADFTRDGYPDLVAAAGPGGGPHVRVLDGKTGEQIAGPVGNFFAYDPAFTGGVQVAAADIDGDGTPDVVTAAGAGGGPHVRAFSGRTGEGLASFFALEADFLGGVSVAAADFTRDGQAEVVVGAGEGGGPRVQVFDAASGLGVAGWAASFFAGDPDDRAGVSVGTDALAGDVDGDGVPDLVTGSGPGLPPRVVVRSGTDGTVLADFAPFDAGMTAGVRVATAYVNDDPFADVVVGTGPGVPGTVRVFDGASGRLIDGPTAEFRPFGDGELGGLFVGASNDPLPEVSVTAYEPVAAELKTLPGPTSGVFEFTRTGDAIDPLTAYYVAGGTATPEVDYVGLAPEQTYTINGQPTLARQVVFPAGVSSVFVRIDALDDGIVEGDETALVTVLAVDEVYDLGAPPADFVTVVDNDPFADPEMLVWIDRTAVDDIAQEWTMNPGKLLLRRSLADGELPVTFTLGGTATLGDDYFLMPETVTFSWGSDRVWVEFMVPPGWTVVEPTETIEFTVLDGPGYTVVDDPFVEVTLYDWGPEEPGAVPGNPPYHYIAFSSTFASWPDQNDPNYIVGADGWAAEGDPVDEGVFLIQTGYANPADPAIPPSPWELDYVLGGTAQFGIDYTVSVEEIGTNWDYDHHIPYGNTFQPGVLQRLWKVVVTPIDDDEWEGPDGYETIDLAVPPPGYPYLRTKPGVTIMLMDNDPAPLPTVSVFAPDPVASEQETSTGSYLFVRDEVNLAFPLTVSYGLEGTATFGAEPYSPEPDYKLADKDGPINYPGYVTFPAGVTKLEVKLTPFDDLEMEGPETATAKIQESPWAYHVGVEKADVLILDNDATAEVSDFVWSDTNADGKQDMGEPGIGGLQVWLYSEFPIIGFFPIAFTTTNNAGLYKFGNLAPGTYKVLFEMNGAMVPADATADDKDSDVTSVDANGFGATDPFGLAAGEKKKTVDAGMAEYDITIVYRETGAETPDDLETPRATTGDLDSKNPQGVNGEPNFLGGKRFFPDAKNFATRTESRNVVRVRVTLNQAKAGVPIHIRSFDVDDPSASIFIDPNDLFGLRSRGMDNRGKVADDPANPKPDLDVPVPIAKGFISGYRGRLRPRPQTPAGNAFAAEGAVVTVNTRLVGGVAIAEVDLATTFNAGDNFRVAAALNRVRIAGLNDTSDVPTKGAIPKFAGLKGTAAEEQLSVWRRLHVETDRMAAIPWTDPPRDKTPAGAAAKITAVADGGPGQQVVTTDLTIAANESFNGGNLWDDSGNHYRIAGVHTAGANAKFTLDFPNGAPAVSKGLVQVSQGDIQRGEMTKSPAPVGGKVEVEVKIPIETADEYKGGILRVNGTNYNIYENSAHAAGTATVTVLSAAALPAAGALVTIYQDDFSATGNVFGSWFQGDVTAVAPLGFGLSRVTTDIPRAQPNQFANGVMVNGAATLPVTGNGGGPNAQFTVFGVAPAVGDTVSVWTTPGANAPVALVSPTDDLNMYDQMKKSMVRTLNRYADAYIEPEYGELDPFRDNDVTPVSHVSLLDENQVTDPATGKLVDVDQTFNFADEFRGKRPGVARPANYETRVFWSVHVVSAYEYAFIEDSDPINEGGTMGIAGRYNGAGGPQFQSALAFLETIRDAWLQPDTVPPEITIAGLRARVTVHEVGHQLLKQLVVGGAPAGDGFHRPDGKNLMNPSPDVPEADYFFHAIEVGTLREIVDHP